MTKKELKLIEQSLNRSQTRVYNYMKENGSITSKQAIDILGETRVGARIYELKKKGFVINSKIIKVKNRFGEERKVAKYWFEK